jgi:thymidine kinase
MDLYSELPALPCLILIDEGQFFSDLLPFTKKALENGYHLFIATLDYTFQRKMWKPVKALFGDESIAPHRELIHLKATCYKCKDPAPWSKRIIDSEELIVPGGNESYVPCCTKCW